MASEPSGALPLLRQRLFDLRINSEKLADSQLEAAVAHVVGTIERFIDGGALVPVATGELAVPPGTPIRYESAGASLTKIKYEDNFSSSFVEDLSTLLLPLEQLVRDTPGRWPELSSEGVGLLFDEFVDQCSTLIEKVVEEIDRQRELYRGLSPLEARRVLDRELRAVRMSTSSPTILARRAVAALERATQAADAAEESAGIAGTASLATFFQSFSRRERVEGWIWRGVLIVILTLATWAAFEHVASVQGLDVSEVLRRMSVGIPIAVLLAFASGEAHAHREHALWAAHMAVQLQTIRAFSEDLGDAEKTALRAAFGRIVFAGPPEVGPRYRGRRVRQLPVTREVMQEIVKTGLGQAGK